MNHSKSQNNLRDSLDITSDEMIAHYEEENEEPLSDSVSSSCDSCYACGTLTTKGPFIISHPELSSRSKYNPCPQCNKYGKFNIDYISTDEELEKEEAKRKECEKLKCQEEDGVEDEFEETEENDRESRDKSEEELEYDSKKQLEETDDSEANDIGLIENVVDMTASKITKKKEKKLNNESIFENDPELSFIEEIIPGPTLLRYTPPEIVNECLGFELESDTSTVQTQSMCSEFISDDPRTKIIRKLLPQRCWEEEGFIWRQVVSTEFDGRIEVQALMQRMEILINERQCQPFPWACELRHCFYTQMFNEVIRQETLENPFRGALLTSCRNELDISLDNLRAGVNGMAKTGMRKFFSGLKEKEFYSETIKKIDEDLDRLKAKVFELEMKKRAMGERFLELDFIDNGKYNDEITFVSKLVNQTKRQIALVTGPKQELINPALQEHVAFVMSQFR